MSFATIKEKRGAEWGSRERVKARSGFERGKKEEKKLEMRGNLEQETRNSANVLQS